MMKVLKNIKSLLSPKRGVIVSHHYGHKGQNPRGASAISADLVSEIHIRNLQKQLKIDLKKTRYERIDPFFIDIDTDADGMPKGFDYSRKVPQKPNYEKEILKILEKGDKTLKEFMRELGEEKSPIDRAVKGLLGKKIEIAGIKAHNEKVYKLK